MANKKTSRKCKNTNNSIPMRILNESPPPYTPTVAPRTSQLYNLRDKIEQLESENKKLTRQVKISQGRLGVVKENVNDWDSDTVCMFVILVFMLVFLFLIILALLYDFV